VSIADPSQRSWSHMMKRMLRTAPMLSPEL
jgi:hypothetical protein